MQNNSIKSNLTKEDIISDIKLSLGADIHRSEVYIIVEGEDDIKFLRSELKIDENVYLYESFDGKNGVEEIVGIEFASNNRVIGIRDRDYSKLRMSENSIFVYDNCCMEMMFIENDLAFNKIYCEFYNGTMQFDQLRNHLLNELSFLSCVRKLNEENCWELLLRHLSISNVFDKKTNKICNKKLFESIKRVNDNKIDELKNKLIEKETSKERTIDELYQITRGHDFANLFATICNLHKSKSISGKTVEECLRCAYTHIEFKNSKLYEALNVYQKIIEINFLVA